MENLQSGFARENVQTGATEKFLTFKLADEEYGLEVMRVVEIIGMIPVTKIPNVASYFKGVINLRGRIIPTIDLRIKFGMEEQEYNEKTCIIVTEIAGEKSKVTAGIIVDEVADVLDIPMEAIEDAPELGDKMWSKFLRGVGLVRGEVKMLLDISNVLSMTDIRVADELARTS